MWIKVFQTAVLFFLVVAGVACVRAADGYVYGEKVRMRRSASINSDIITTVDTGVPFRILETTTARDTLSRPGWGYLWYRLALPTGVQGWMYGEFVYLLEKKPEKNIFYSKGSEEKLRKRELRIDGGVYTFVVAVEPAYPVYEKDKGLTGSAVHGLPLFLRRGSSGALPLMVVLDEIPFLIFREHMPARYWYRLINSEGVGEKIDSIEPVVYRGKQSLKIIIAFISQTGGGTYHLIAVPEQDRFRIAEYRFLTGLPY